MGRKSRITGWVLSILIAAFFIAGSGFGLATGFEPMKNDIAEMGWTIERMKPVAVLEILFSLVFILPRIGFWGAILLTGYLGGAVATHMRLGQPPFAPIIFAALIWIALGLRQPAIFRLAAGKDDGSRGVAI